MPCTKEGGSQLLVWQRVQEEAVGATLGLQGATPGLQGCNTGRAGCNRSLLGVWIYRGSLVHYSVCKVQLHVFRVQHLVYWVHPKISRGNTGHAGCTLNLQGAPNVTRCNTGPAGCTLDLRDTGCTPDLQSATRDALLLVFQTRIRGITERPRHMIDCEEYVTEFKSCDYNPTTIQLDAEYCETVDHTGRPIGEYGKCACVGEVCVRVTKVCSTKQLNAQYMCCETVDHTGRPIGEYGECACV